MPCLAHPLLWPNGGTYAADDDDVGDEHCGWSGLALETRGCQLKRSQPLIDRRLEFIEEGIAGDEKKANGGRPTSRATDDGLCLDSDALFAPRPTDELLTD